MSIINPLTQDGAYENAFLSVGTSRDRTSATKAAAPTILDPISLGNLYTADGYAAKIVDIPAAEMVRAGYRIEGVDDERAVEAETEGLKLLPKMADALRWSYLFGGALVVMLIDDGGKLTDPLREDRIKVIDQLRVYDRWHATRLKRYEDPADNRYGEIEVYQISPANGAPYTVHESRCIRIDGLPVPDDMREYNDGWGGSVVNRCYSELVRQGLAQGLANSLLERAQQGVHGIPGLSDLLRQSGGPAMVAKRVEIVDMVRSVNNTVVIDAAETYELKSTPLSGVADILDRVGLALAAVSRIPESLLHGRQQAGMNSTGASDLEQWYARIGQEQETRLLPAIDRIVSLILKMQGQYTNDYLIKFLPLWVPSDKEQAEADKIKADTRATYNSMGALDPSEVRAMLKDEGYKIDDIDLEYGEEETV